MAVNTIDRESARDHPWPAETTTEALENSIENIILCNFCVFKIKFCSLSVFTVCVHSVCVHSVFTLFASGACEAYHAARLRRRIDGKKSSDSQSEVNNAEFTQRERFWRARNVARHLRPWQFLGVLNVKTPQFSTAMPRIIG